MCMQFQPSLAASSIIDIPDLMARRALGAQASSDEARREWIEFNYAGAWPSREHYVAKVTMDRDEFSRYLAGETIGDFDLDHAMQWLFERTFCAVDEGDSVHIFDHDVADLVARN